MKISPYTIYLEMQPDAVLVRPNFIICKKWVLQIMSNLHSCGPLAYYDNERAKQLLYALDDHVQGLKITAL
jgi:hypothetical protein